MRNILILEDDQIQRFVLTSIIQELGEEYRIFAVSTKKEAIYITENHVIDLFLIDIKLSDGSGIQFAEKIRQYAAYEFAWILFITSYPEYTMISFKKIHCYDCLIKPYDKDEVKRLVVKLANNSLSKIQDKEKGKEFIFVNVDGINIKIFKDEIVFVEVYLRNCIIHTVRGKFNKKNTSLKSIINSINYKQIIQSHRSYLINLNRIDSIDKNSLSWKVYFYNYNEHAYIGDKFKKNIIEYIESTSLKECSNNEK